MSRVQIRTCTLEQMGEAAVCLVELAVRRLELQAYGIPNRWWWIAKGKPAR